MGASAPWKATARFKASSTVAAGSNPRCSISFGSSGASHEDPGCVPEPLQWVGCHDAVDGMEAIAEAVLVDVLRSVKEILLEQVLDLVRIPRSGQHPLPDLPVGGVMDVIPDVRARGGQYHGTTGPAQGLDHTSQVSQTCGYEGEERVHMCEGCIRAPVGDAVKDDIRLFSDEFAPGLELPFQDLQGGLTRLCDPSSPDPRHL
jgi:hypothetical protein